MKHSLSGVLFLSYLFVLSHPCFASIDLNISSLTQKDDYYQVTAQVSGMSSSSATYIQGMFTPVDSSKYFGFTLSKKGEWLSYDGSPEKNFVLENYLQLENNSPQTIYLKPNYTDKNYQGPGKYLLKLKRYTASGSSSDYSNSLELNLNQAVTPPTPTPTVIASHEVPKQPQSTVTPPPSTPTKSSIVTPSGSVSLVKGRSSEAERDSSPPSPQVLATTSSDISTESSPVIPAQAGIHQINSTTDSTPSSPILSDKKIFLIGILIFSISGGLLYFRLKNL